MQFCGDLPLFIYLADTHARHIAHRNRIKAIETAEMVDINNRPRRRIGLNNSYDKLRVVKSSGE